MKGGIETWKIETDKLKENTEVELKQVSVCNDNKVMKNNEKIINEVSDSCKNKLTISSGKIVENELFKSDTVKKNRGDEVFGEVEFNNEVLASVDETERGCEERLGEQLSLIHI